MEGLSLNQIIDRLRRDGDAGRWPAELQQPNPPQFVAEPVTAERASSKRAFSDEVGDGCDGSRNPVTRRHRDLGLSCWAALAAWISAMSQPHAYRWLRPLVEYLRRPGEAGGDEVSGFRVCTGEPRGVDLERGCSAASVAEPACHGAQVDAASE